MEQHDPGLIAEGLLRFGPFDASSAERIRSLGFLALGRAAAMLPQLEGAARRTAAHALALAPDREHMVAHVRAVLSDDTDTAAWGLRALATLARVDDEAALLPVARRRAAHPRALVRAGVADLLAKFVSEDASAVLDRLLRDDDPFVRERAAEALRHGDRPSERALASRALDLMGSDATRRHDAIEALVGARDISTIARLLQDASARARESALYAAARLADENLWTPLVRLIDDPTVSDHQRALALRALRVPANTDELAVFSYLARFARHPDPFIRAACAVVCGRAGSPRIRSVAGTLASDPDEFVRETAITHLAMPPHEPT